MSPVRAAVPGDYGRRSLDAFEFKDGLVWREHEFLRGHDPEAETPSR